MTKAKTAKTAADAKKPAEPKKKAEVKAKAVRPEAEKAKTAKKVSKDTERIKAPAPAASEKETEAAEAKSVQGFSNAGLGVKVASKKPALSVAPGVMILGRSGQSKSDSTPRPSDRRLSKKEQLDIKNFLMERRERLLAGMRRELAMQKERAASKAADDVDKATDAYDEDLSFEIATANDQELEEIQVALEKIEKGTYGECEICGCAISPSRLKVLPSATTCVACRGQEELARRRDDGPSFSMITGEDGEGEGDAM